ADGKLGVGADIGGLGRAKVGPQENIWVNNGGTNRQVSPGAPDVGYEHRKKTAAGFMEKQARDGGRVRGAYREWRRMTGKWARS
ncbi:hypothetical protein, partial [Escherichia coli]|uniref:hypothetical protein n=1 Tax=Escherichia coli TaxID=562 RepID=UPI001BFD1358